ncbi:MAG: hypothetical protein WD357_09495 [Gracilimonas sp.]
MNIGIITSYIIAGIILISLLMMNMRVSTSSAEITLTQITREKTLAITEMLYYDIPNMGYNQFEKTPQVITIADSSKIQFYRKIDRFSSGDPELITWELTDTPVSETPNPNDKILVRTVDNGSVEEVTEMRQGVTRFRLYYFDEHGLSSLPSDGQYMSTPITGALRDSVKQVYIALELQSAEPLRVNSNNSRYIRSAWEKRFSPNNLEN